jgi:hypothetical protein
MSRTNIQGWVTAAIVVLGIVALLAWARNDPGVDDRDPDPPSTVIVVVPGPPSSTVGDAVPPTTT